jgi:alkaline phosphatase/alkaline phosphatase D
MRTIRVGLLFVLSQFFCIGGVATAKEPVYLAQGLLAGEVTENSAILQSRLTRSQAPVDDHVAGATGTARFEYSTSADFKRSSVTDWIVVTARNDFIVKAKVAGLTHETKYFYRLEYGQDIESSKKSPVGSFRTLGGKAGKREVSFVVVTGMNYEAFHYGQLIDGQRKEETAYSEADASLGYPALEAIKQMKPDFFVGTGDNVYYDSRDAMEAKSLESMRRKWHLQFSQPRFVELFRHVPTYWEKDDHDHRYNDCDRTGARLPSNELGISVFREQVPVVDLDDPNSKTYRTFRINRHLQIWLVEGRDYRSPNGMEDGLNKTLWGAEQIEWLKESLLSSNAAHKVLISPTPMVGPDDAYKIDNHTNERGFRHEGRAFFRWIKQHELDKRGFVTICGDRHWQYHSVDPTGIEEFSSGAICDANSRLGRRPGDPDSTDPDAKIRQLYTQAEASGGFLRVTVNSNAEAHFHFYDEKGKLLYRTVKAPTDSLSLLGTNAPKLLYSHLIKQVHRQYDERRRAVTKALESRDLLKTRLTQLRDSLQRIVGDLPDKTPLHAQTTGVIHTDGYRIEKVHYQSRPHHYVTASLYVPTTGSPPFPGVLVACGHSSLGKAYEPYQRIGALLATNGMVALVYDPIGQGERRAFFIDSKNAGLQHKLVNVNSILVGRTAVGYQVWDGIRSIDYLLSRPEVDHALPIGMTGNSGGGAQTMHLMALDDRIGPAAPSCHITTLERNFELGGAGDGCQSAPLTGAEGIDHPDFFAIRAPRPSIVLAAKQDYKDIRFTRKTYQEAKAVYELLNEPERIELFEYNDKHSFSQPRREAATQWMRRWLLGDPSPVSEHNATMHSAETLQVTKTGQVLREFSDAVSISELNLRRARELVRDRAEFWNSKSTANALAAIRQFIGIRGNSQPLKVESMGTVQRDKYVIEKLALQRTDELPIPALLFRNRDGVRRRPATLLVDGRGKLADLQRIENKLAAGHLVLSIDLRGFGESANRQSEIVYANGDHDVAMLSMHVGHSLLGQRVEELLVALSYLRASPEVDGDQVHLDSYGQAGPVALHAALWETALASVTLRSSIKSWVEDVVACPLDLNSISHVIPSALKKYDLPDLARRLSDKLTYE